MTKCNANSFWYHFHETMIPLYWIRLTPANPTFLNLVCYPAWDGTKTEAECTFWRNQLRSIPLWNIYCLDGSVKFLWSLSIFSLKSIEAAPWQKPCSSEPNPQEIWIFLSKFQFFLIWTESKTAPLS